MTDFSCVLEQPELLIAAFLSLMSMSGKKPDTKLRVSHELYVKSTVDVDPRLLRAFESMCIRRLPVLSCWDPGAGRVSGNCT